MTHRVVFLQSAADDLFEIRRYVKHFSPPPGWTPRDQEGDVNLERPAPAMRRPSCPSLTFSRSSPPRTG